MKLLQLIHRPQNRGAETFACQLSNHLIRLGHQVKIVAIFEGEAALPFEGEITCLNASSKNRFFDLRGWKALSDIIDSFQPDIVQANAGDTLKYAIFSKQVFRWNVPILFRNASEVGRYLNSTFQRFFNSFLYKQVDGVASVSRASELDIIRHFPSLKGKTEVLPIGLEEKTEIPAVQLKPPSVKHIVHVGGFTFEKNHLGLLRILRMVLKNEGQVHLHLVGDGPLKKDIEVEVQNMSLEAYVTFYGFINNPLTIIDAADVLVLPSIIEGLPGVLLEAMYCKTPVVAYDVGGISEIVRPDTGFLIEKENEGSFVNAVVEVLKRPDNSKIVNANKMVRKEFMNEEIALKFVNSYRKLVDGEE